MARRLELAERSAESPHPMSEDKRTAERDMDARPYSADEARVAKFFFDRGTGSGDDPIGAILASHAYTTAELTRLRKERDELVEALMPLARWAYDQTQKPSIAECERAFQVYAKATTPDGLAALARARDSGTTEG